MKIEFFDTKPKTYWIEYSFDGYILNACVVANNKESALAKVRIYRACDKILSCTDIGSLGE